MVYTVEKIDSDEHFEYKGDVHVTGSIGKNATVIITGGSLTVDGNVEEKSDINLTQSANNNVSIMSGGTFFSGSTISIGGMSIVGGGNSVVIGGGSTSPKLHVKGNVDDGVKITSHAAELIVDGTVGSRATLKTYNGDITTTHIGESTKLDTYNGDVSCGNVGANSILKSYNGEINAGDMAENSNANTYNGNVRVKKAHESATLSTYNGSVYEKGVKRKKKEQSQSSSISIGGMSFIGGVSGRIIVNGRDITDLVNNSSSNSSNAPEVKQEPVRFKKF